MSKTMSQGLLDIYVAPKQLLDALPAKKGWSWLPFILLLVSSAFASWWLFQGMSPEWLVEQQIAASAHKMTPAEIEQSRALFGQMADKMPLIALGSAIVMTPIILALLALYLMLVGNPGTKRAYGDWYALAVWSYMPYLLVMLGLMVLIAVSNDPNLPLNAANFLSINQLLLGLQPGDAWFAWADNLNLIYFWMVGLMATGLHSWSGYSPVKSTLLAALPLLIIFGLWAVFI
ncbi:MULTISPECIES: YIP1 family protein [Alkalimonas]|uniref:YIP1 family protein n=1 Tax=Alkalimonas mucilaginosa TaxID=3057676 RepID=A0ABU7JB25_9GAMM|nr:YIP1 family protein [Alkalimonas sp. MEB004]MEE2022860.1 YIP1 family protein [Alkalimonas sp. MEB004]